MTSSSLSLSHLRECEDLFPMLTLCSCISDAEESRNGSRYAAQDKFTKAMYEVRCVRMQLPEKKEDNEPILLRQQRRLDSLVEASQQKDLPHAVTLPIDVYMQEVAATTEFFIVSVSSFTGLSLADIIRSGWRLIEEKDFYDILKCIEEYGLQSPRLPPHRNLSLNAVVRLLTPRPGAVELRHKSRWVIGDWGLLSEDVPSAKEVVADMEWLLYSAFSKLNVASDRDGTLFTKDTIEFRINDTIERVREGLIGGSKSRRLSRLNDTCLEETSPTRHGAPSLEWKQRILMHQKKFREENQLVTDYRKPSRGGGGHPRRPPHDAHRDPQRSAHADARVSSPLRAAADVRPSAAICALAAPDALDALDALGGWAEGLAECRRRAARRRAEAERARLIRRDALRATVLRAVVMGAQRLRSPRRSASPKASRSRSGSCGADSAESATRGMAIRVSFSPAPGRARREVPLLCLKGLQATVSATASPRPSHAARTARAANERLRLLSRAGREGKGGAPLRRPLPRTAMVYTRAPTRTQAEKNAHIHILTAEQTHLWLSESEIRRRSRSAGGARHISRARVRPVNETSLGTTRTRRLQGVYDPY